MISSVEVRTASSGHLRLTPTQVHGSCTSAPLTLTLRMAAVSQAAIHSAASLFLPELSAAFLFRLCCRAISAGAVVTSAVEVRAATSGHLHLTPTQIHGAWTSAPLTLTLRVAIISRTAYPSAASPRPSAGFRASEACERAENPREIPLPLPSSSSSFPLASRSRILAAYTIISLGVA